MRPCPSCRSPLAEDRCVACGGHWLGATSVDALAPGRLGPLRRLVGKGPLTHLTCADCGFALKSLDVPGPQHEGDLFWGLESPRPAGTSVAEGCARCGGVFVDAGNLSRAGGPVAFGANLARVMRDAS